MEPQSPAIIYEFMKNGSLHYHLHEVKVKQILLNTMHITGVLCVVIVMQENHYNID